MVLDRKRIAQTAAAWRTALTSPFRAAFWRSRTSFGLAAAALSVVGIGLFVYPAHATSEIFTVVGLIIAWAMHYIVAFEGWVLIKIVGVLIWVAQYNGFVDANPVATGWFIVRDIVNMFFILVLLLIAFGTILGVEAYNYKKTLPKLLISAVVVNFTRTICGLLIDLSQVIMLTFVNGFSEAATGNFANAFRINKLLQAEKPTGGQQETEAMDLVAGWLLAGVLVGFAVVVVTVMTIVLIVRIIVLWVLVILSPLAFFLRAVPSGAATKYYGEWWSRFTAKVVAGPAIAFFLWLALLTTSGSGGVISQGKFDTNINVETGETASADVSSVGMFAGNDLAAFIIGICLMMVGLQAAQQMGGVAAQTVTGAPGKAWKAAKGAAKVAGRVAEKTPGLGAARDRGKEMALRGLSYVPGMKGTAMKALGEHRADVAKKGADASKWLSQLSPEERARMSRSMVPEALMSSSQRGIKREALKQHLDDVAKGKGVELRKGETKDSESYQQRVKAEYFRTRDQLESLGTRTFDKSVADHVTAANKKRPDLIVNPNETDPAKLKKQRDELRKVAMGLGVTQMQDMEAGAMSQEVMMFVSPKSLEKAMERMNASQLQALSKMGINDGMDANAIRTRQQELRMSRSEYLSDAERKNLMDGEKENFRRARVEEGGAGDPAAQMRAQERQRDALQRMMSLSGKELSDSEVLAAAAAVDGGAAMIQRGLASGELTVPAQQMADNQRLAQQVAEGMNASDIRNLPAELANVLREALARNNEDGHNSAKIVESGGRLGQALGQYDFDERSSDFGTVAGAEAFGEHFADNKDAWSQRIDAATLRRNGGTNDLAVGMVAKMDADDVLEMGAQNQQGAHAVIDSAVAIRAAVQDKDEKDRLVSDYRARMVKGGRSEGEADSLSQAYAARLDAAAAQADVLLRQVASTPSPLTAALKAAQTRQGKKAWQKEMSAREVEEAERKQQEKAERKQARQELYEEAHPEAKEKRLRKEEAARAKKEAAALRQEMEESYVPPSKAEERAGVAAAKAEVSAMEREEYELEHPEAAVARRKKEIAAQEKVERKRAAKEAGVQEKAARAAGEAMYAEQAAAYEAEEKERRQLSRTWGRRNPKPTPPAQPPAGPPPEAPPPAEEFVIERGQAAQASAQRAHSGAAAAAGGSSAAAEARIAGQAAAAAMEAVGEAQQQMAQEIVHAAEGLQTKGTEAAHTISETMARTAQEVGGALAGGAESAAASAGKVGEQAAGAVKAQTAAMKKAAEQVAEAEDKAKQAVEELKNRPKKT